MDGKGRRMVNIFIDRFWKSVKYEKIFLEELMTIEQMCARAMKKGFIWVIGIKENEIGDIISTTHKCSDR